MKENLSFEQVMNKDSTINDSAQFKDNIEIKDPTIQYEKSKVNFTKDASSPADFKYYPDSPTSLMNKTRFNMKQASKFYDPCAESSKMSIRCMEVNGRENKEACNEFFQAYRDCKKEWMKERKKSKLEGKDGW